MAQLGGKNVRTLVTQLELLSDDGSYVLTIENTDSSTGPRIKVRRPWQSPWDSGLAVWQVATRDADLVSKAIAGHDTSYNRTALDAVDNTRFTGDDPEAGNEAAIAAGVEARCSELDIERAKSARIAEERELLRLTLVHDHSLDRHATGMVEGCESCDKSLANVIGQRSYLDASAEDEHLEASYESSVSGDEDDLPF